ncbi:MAG: hypothetical protein K0R54_703 [Clostridiaceae bacterium]|jgi:hypothetical protein|nr:hypothetical protein [Clostridiaceae bacterium]
MGTNLKELCKEYIENIYETTHAKGNEVMGLAMQRRDIHDLILYKLKAEREDGILKITDNLDWLTINGKTFDIYKDYTKNDLERVAHSLNTSLEMYCAKKYPKQTVIECNTDTLENFTKGNTYLAVRDYDDIVEVYDDNGELYGIDKELELELEDLSEGDFSYCYIGSIG